MNEIRQASHQSNVPSVQERFFNYFQHEITGMCPLWPNSSCWRILLTILLLPALQDQMGRLEDTALIGGERTDATEHCLAGIARLQVEVKETSSYLPTYDQRTYAEVQEPSRFQVS